MSECIGKLRLAHPTTHFLSDSLAHSLILRLTNWLTYLPTYWVTHWLTNCLTHHLLGHSPIQSLNWVTETWATHCSSHPFFHSSIHLKQLDTRINKNKSSHPFISSLSHSFCPPDYQPKLIHWVIPLHPFGCTIINYLPLTHWSAFLTHRGPVTQYCDGSILCKNPIFFTIKEFPQI